jgi:hypothetical protein
MQAFVIMVPEYDRAARPAVTGVNCHGARSRLDFRSCAETIDGSVGAAPNSARIPSVSPLP